MVASSPHHPEPLALRIESAPRDGRVLVALDELGHPHLVWGDERGFFDEATGEEVHDLEWWSPIPSIP